MFPEDNTIVKNTLCFQQRSLQKSHALAPASGQFWLFFVRPRFSAVTYSVLGMLLSLSAIMSSITAEISTTVFKPWWKWQTLLGNTLLFVSESLAMDKKAGFLLGIFSGGGEGQNPLLCKFLLLCYCFRTKFQGGAKVFREANCSGGRPRPPPLWKKAKR